MPTDQPNVLFVMTDQQRFDTIAALGNDHLYTPNFDRLVERGVSFTNAYSQVPVCVPARYNYRTGREPPTSGYYGNTQFHVRDGNPEDNEERCGPYLARAMAQRGYRTFGVGKFHTQPSDEDLGYETKLTKRDYDEFLSEKHPELEHLRPTSRANGEYTEMYYMPQRRPVPRESGHEAWVADRTVEQMAVDDDRPFFGLVSMTAPHPPVAPPVPYNRMYDPAEVPDPVLGDAEVDLMDEQLEWMHHLVFAEEVDSVRTSVLRARYYGEISYIDECIGRILDAVEAREDADDTLICFFSDHGDHLGDHHAWQKESFFEESARVPFLLSWPSELPGNERNDELVSLTDLFGIATGAAGDRETRDGIDVLGMLDGEVEPRERLFGYYGHPGPDPGFGEGDASGARFKLMVREDDWKYVYLSNGDRDQLFDLAEDPRETDECASEKPEVVSRLRERAVRQLRADGLDVVLDGDDLRSYPYAERERRRIYQLPMSSFPEEPADVFEQMPE